MSGAGSLGVAQDRLWATRADNLESVLLDSTSFALTAPAWAPEGNALAFGRFVKAAGQPGRFEVVVQSAPDQQRVLQRIPCRIPPPQALDLAGMSLAWSPDGRYLAVPQVETTGVVVVRVDNGRPLKTLEGAIKPAWSPEGGLLAFYREGSPASLWVLESPFAEPRKLTELADIDRLPAPLWGRDGQSILCLRRSAATGGPNAFTQMFQLIRVRVDRTLEEPVSNLVHDLIGRDKALRSASIGMAPEGEDLFYTLNAEGQSAFQITWARPRSNEVHKRFSPFDDTVPIGSLAVSPLGRRLALRVSAAQGPWPAALCDPETERLTPLAPDAQSRDQWTVVLLSSIRHALENPQVLRSLGSDPSLRACLLPVPREISADHPLGMRVRRLAQLGRMLGDESKGGPTPALPRPLQNEAGLIFNYLSEDFPAALASLDRLEAGTVDRDRKLRLLGVRAQIFLGERDFDRAEATISYLQSLSPSGQRRFEESPVRLAIGAADSQASAWVQELSKRAAALKKFRPAMPQELDSPIDFNPDAPRPGLGLDAVPLPPRPAAPDRPIRLPPRAAPIN